MIYLGSRTGYSFMRGYGTPKQWLERCKTVGATAFAITDYCGTWGHIPFRKAFKGSNVKLLYGVQLPVCHALEKDPRHAVVTLIAKSSLEELYSAVSLATKQTYYRPRLTWRQVHDLKDCLVLVNEATDRDRRVAKDFLRHDYVACYPSTEHRTGFEMLQALSDGHRLGDLNSEALPLLRRDELLTLGIEMPEIDLTQFTADIPRAKPVQLTGDLYEMAIRGAHKLGLAGFQQGEQWPMFYDHRYAERLERELKVIKEKDFESYFFFVADLVQWARKRMLVGPGRGSSGGSLLCYLLGITSVDPIVHGTLFERFIDITRPDLPDIDVDFPQSTRDEVYQYLRDKYGAERVAKLGTIAEFGGKSALNDTAKITDIPLTVAREIGKFTEGATQGQVLSIDHALKQCPELVEKYPDIAKALLIEGQMRHSGVHAAGVVVPDMPVVNYGSLTSEGVIQMDMNGAEEQGLVKMDVLGLRTLDVIKEACVLAGVDPDSLPALPLDDKSVYDEVFNKDRVVGIFQFEGQAVRQLLRQVQIDAFEDLAAITSLARPGPLVAGAADLWIKRRNGDADADHEEDSVGARSALAEILEPTFGVICYQEQVMQIARRLANFDEPSVNGLRRAIGKKDPEKLRGYREQWLAGITKNMGEDAANELWHDICEFGSYGFNRSHAVAYSIISYWTAWLKRYHPLEFACAQLRHAPDDDSAIALLQELGAEGYQYVPLDLSISDANWSIHQGVLYGGLCGVRGIGEKTAGKLVEIRREHGAGWLDKLTDAQRAKLTAEYNTKWHQLSYFGQKFKLLYERPGEWVRPYSPHGIKGPIKQIRDIADRRGEYAFLGRIVRKQIKSMNDPERVAKRGTTLDGDPKFCHVFVQDDTGELPTTIGYTLYDKYKEIIEGHTDGKDYFFRGKIASNGRRWLFVDKIVELTK